MDQLFKLNNSKSWKTLLLNGNQLMLVNKSYDHPAEFLEKFHEKGLLKERLEISIDTISQLSYAENDADEAGIAYSVNNKENIVNLEFQSDSEQQEFVQAIIQQRKFTATTQQVALWQAISSPLIGLAVTAAFTYVVYEDARITEAGGHVSTTGRRALYKKLFAWLGETLGTKGALLVGGAIALICIYLIYRNLKNRPAEIIYS